MITKAQQSSPWRATKGRGRLDAPPLFISLKAKPPTESWWTQPVSSREEFDRRAAARGREAGWIGIGLKT